MLHLTLKECGSMWCQPVWVPDSEEPLHFLMDEFQNFLRKWAKTHGGPPHCVTIARSCADNFLPMKYLNFVESGVH